MLKLKILQEYDENYKCYGARKMWLVLRGQDVDVARCTVERLMRSLGLQSARRGRFKRTTISDPAATRPQDLVKRNFQPLAPNKLWVADFTYVSTLAGWVYVAFVTDAYARRILGWKGVELDDHGFGVGRDQPDNSYTPAGGRQGPDWTYSPQ